MELKTIESNTDSYIGKLTIGKKFLVFPVQSTLITLLFPPLLTFLIYLLLVFFPGGEIITFLNSIYTLEISLLLGFTFALIVAVYWYKIWKDRFNTDNVIEIKINTNEQILDITKHTKLKENLDSFKIHFDLIINLVIGRSADGNPDGWALNLFIREGSSKKPTSYSVFVVNDEGLLDLYDFSLNFRDSLEKMDLLNMFRISDIFLRKVKERKSKTKD